MPYAFDRNRLKSHDNPRDLSCRLPILLFIQAA